MPDPAFPDGLSTEHLFDAHIELAPGEHFGEGRFGRRSFVQVLGGTFAGERLRGVYRPAGGDWVLSLKDGHNELDVRATMETEDGALIYIAYPGVLRVDADTSRRVLAGEDVPAGAYYFRTTPRFETGSPAYDWLNSLVCVGYGRFGANRVDYRVFAVR